LIAKENVSKLIFADWIYGRNFRVFWPSSLE